MSGPRRLGAGRVLGNASLLSPNASPGRSSHERKPSLLSPSESSISLTSELSASQPSSETQDLSSRVSLEGGDRSVAAAARSKLVCPICDEEMMTLLQLNRHLDDDHRNLEEEEQDEVKTWFRTQMVKAKRFQPLAVLNQKLKGLDVFESNDEGGRSAPPATTATTATAVEVSRPPPDELVTRAHWQRSAPGDICLEPTCGKPLNVVNGSVNCRKCGKLFCEEHTMYQMKLSRSAQPEPVRGIWCRVCETCYKSREGYNDHTGASRDHTEEFAKTRRRVTDKKFLDVSRLEKRLTRLTQLLANPPIETAAGSGSIFWPLGGQKNQRKILEQSVVSWEDDSVIPRCPFCQQEFSTYTLRKHHCRTCGRVVCSDPQTACSIIEVLDVAIEKSSDQVSVEVRMCRDCKATLFGRRELANDVSKQRKQVKTYETLIQFERGIRLMLPKFQRLLIALQDPNKPPTSSQLSEASHVRKRLIDAFSQYNTAANRLRDMPTDSATQQKLQKAIHQQASNFLHLHMLPLKSLPKVLKHASPHGINNSTSGRPATQRSSNALAAIKYNDIDSASQISSSSAVSAIEAEEKELRERLIVLEEQKFFVGEMIANANKRRKFDEVSSLAQNSEDLSKEIDQINGMLAQLDFASVYERVASPNPKS
ncbi:MAG: hypothetical protein M1825_000948 [Sarcosagium campestre]|nr:MAG: hypothetical protein M1825_000948 [Sarcosagium campestre]